MYITNVQTKSEWQDVADLVSTKISDTFAFSSDNTYHITNNSDYSVYLVNATTKPSTKDLTGMVLQPKEQVVFKPGTSVKLWALSLVGACDICIEQEG